MDTERDLVMRNILKILENFSKEKLERVLWYIKKIW